MSQVIVPSVSTVAAEPLHVTPAIPERASVTLPENDPVRRRPNTTRAKQRLGWQPTVSLKDGLSQTVAYFRSVLEQS